MKLAQKDATRDNDDDIMYQRTYERSIITFLTCAVKKNPHILPTQSSFVGRQNSFFSTFGLIGQTSAFPFRKAKKKESRNV